MAKMMYNIKHPDWVNERIEELEAKANNSNPCRSSSWHIVGEDAYHYSPSERLHFITMNCMP